MDPVLLLLAVPSTLVLVGMVAHSVLWRGTRATAIYFGWVLCYGIARSRAIRWVSADQMRVASPYLMNRPVWSFAGVSLQELAGWVVALTLAWLLSDTLLRRIGIAPAPHRSAAAAALGMAAVCLAVENGAIAAGWWTWTLALPRGVIRVPAVALLDWGFVALDALLPYLAFVTPSSRATRVAAALVFPLHMLGHTWVLPLPEPLPVAGNDLVHVGIAAYVLWRALSEAEAARTPLPAARLDRARVVPPLCALVVALAPVAALLARGADPRGAIASLPLALLAVAALAAAEPRRTERRPAAGTLRIARAAVIVGAAVLLAGVRAPATRRQQRLVGALERGTTRLNAGDRTGAEAAFREALEFRPDHPGAHTLLALALFREGRRPEGRRELEHALASDPTARDALILLTSLDLSERRLGEAAERAALGRRVYPERAEFVYQAALAAGAAGPGRPPALEAVAVARRVGRGALADLAVMARAFGDTATADACADAPQ